MDLPVYSDILAAAELLEGQAVRTPLVTSRVLNDRLGAQVYFKPECLQRTGSFKFRGAYNAISNLPQSVKTTGIVACSSGNHAQGVAEAARIKGYQATILMPSDAPESKKNRTKRSGAEVIEYDRFGEDREQLTAELAEKRGAPIVHPYENFHVIAGQGTAGLEIAQDMKSMGLAPEHVLVCTGGGGLLAGTLLSMQEYFPDCALHTVEPDGYDDQRRSHLAGKIIGENTTTPSICDAIVTPTPGKLSFSICQGNLGECLSASDEEALVAVAFAFHELKLVVEPGGAITLAALLAGNLDVKGKTVVATLSGGNIDPDMMARALAL